MRLSARPLLPLMFTLLATAGVVRAQARPHHLTLSLLDTAVLVAPRLDESSGVAASRHHPGLLWTHNDSGDGPYFYATDSTGRDLGAIRLGVRRTWDWEDIALAPCIVQPGDCLYAGDIGDNDASRRRIAVYRVREPAPPTGSADTNRIAPLLDSIVLHYPDHPHNAEGLAVTASGRLLIVTKELRGQPIVFTARFARGDTAATLVPLCTLSIRTDLLRGRIATGAALSPDGTMLAVRTYVSLHLFRTDAACSPLLPPEGLVIPVVESQGEAVDFYAPDRLVLTSERGLSGHAIVTRLRLEGPVP